MIGGAALGFQFRITGLGLREAQDLALLLRAGALAAPVYKVDERTIGPTLGAENIERGFKAIQIGFLAVIVFMAIYYRWFGMIANLALLSNLVFIVAMLSILGASLTLPGIAGIVLTVGMAVDANVLIFERIREELAAGASPQEGQGPWDGGRATVSRHRPAVRGPGARSSLHPGSAAP